MSVMNAAKKSKALVRPLRAGNSRAGERPGRIRASKAKHSRRVVAGAAG
jgi:hypothetical protein